MSPTKPVTETFDLFASAAPGLEPVTLREVRALGFGGAKSTAGGCAFRGSLRDVAKANLWLRTATRVLLRLTSFEAPGRRELVARARRLSLSPFIAERAPVRLHVSATRSRLYHTGLIAEAFHEAMGTTDAAKDSVAPDLFIRFENDRCTISIDTSGELLHRRGYRQDVSHAPLRETLAAGMLLLCGYDGTLPLIDPMCGSGTIPIEAFLIATNTPPGLRRDFAWQTFPSADSEWLETLRAEAAKGQRPTIAPIKGSDIHAGALSAARRNAERAGAAAIEWERADASRLLPPGERGLLLTNPPYGKRVGGRVDRSANEAVDTLSRLIDGPFARWQASVLAPGKLLQRVQRKAKEIRLDNGGIPVTLTQFEPRGD